MWFVSPLKGDVWCLLTYHLLRMGTRDNKDNSRNNVEVIALNIQSSIYLESLFVEIMQPLATNWETIRDRQWTLKLNQIETFQRKKDALRTRHDQLNALFHLVRPIPEMGVVPLARILFLKSHKFDFRPSSAPEGCKTEKDLAVSRRR